MNQYMGCNHCISAIASDRTVTNSCSDNSQGLPSSSVRFFLPNSTTTQNGRRRIQLNKKSSTHSYFTSWVLYSTALQRQRNPNGHRSNRMIHHTILHRIIHNLIALDPEKH